MTDISMQAAGDDWRDRVLTDPDMLLEDGDVMRALSAASERRMGANVIDLRGIAMARLEERLARLEDAHRTVIAAACDNVAGTAQIHRCVLELLEAETLAQLLDLLPAGLSDIVHVSCVRLVLESPLDEEPPHPAVSLVPAGSVMRYLTEAQGGPVRQVTLRSCGPEAARVFGEDAADLRSEALLHVDLGPGKLGALLAFGSVDPQQFHPAQGTELLAFFAQAFQRILRGHLE